MTDVMGFEDVIGRTAVDNEGNKIGKIGQIYVDDRSGQPQWVTVSTGLFGTKESFAPLHGSRLDGENLQLRVSKDLVKDAPNIDADGQLEDAENDALYAHYGATQQNGATDRQERGHDTSGPNPDDAMTRSEEQLHVGTENVESGRARLRKYVVTENVTQTVPVSHEEVRVEREPITDANREDAMTGGDITEEEHEITLHAEQPVVGKETVPVERVRMTADTVTDEETVSADIRKEQIDTPETGTKSGR